MTRKMPTGSPAPWMLCAMMALAACDTPAPVQNRTPGVTATEAALCRAWAESLPGRSRQDTPLTQAEIGQAYDAQAAACPAFARFGPQ
jgi:hypothetical protein